MNIRKTSISIVAGVIAALTAASAAAAPDVALVRERAEQGVVESQFALGNMYFKGNGVEQNIEEALKWYRRAAEKGNAMAQLKLGFILRGVARSRPRPGARLGTARPANDAELGCDCGGAPDRRRCSMSRSSTLRSGLRLFDKVRSPSSHCNGKWPRAKFFGRAVTLPYAHLHLFLHRRTSASCERSAESFSRKGV